MKIVNITKIYDKEYNILSYSRSAIVSMLVSEIKKAQSVTDLAKYSSCEIKDDLCFIYNNACKLFFIPLPNGTEVELIRFTFKNHNLNSELT